MNKNDTEYFNTLYTLYLKKRHTILTNNISKIEKKIVRKGVKIPIFVYRIMQFSFLNRIK